MLVKEKKLRTYCAFAESVAFSQNKHHISIFNGAGSGVVLRLRKLFLTNMQLSAVTGVACRFDLRHISALSAGTDITAKSHDSAQIALPSEVLVKTGGTATDVGINCSLTFVNDEAGSAGWAYDYQHINWLPDGETMQAVTLREGEGFTVRQATNTTVGAFGWLLVLTTEDLA